ncbi:MAG TPA: peptidoglycan DD-metalloendopeptidase family protein [Stellaceae bacterium]|nr:peptidoglycan DD-metalloendopeptidase family protein [Stellaceae bacterium]
MPLNRLAPALFGLALSRAFGPVLAGSALALLLALAVPASAAPADTPAVANISDELDAIREQCIVAARMAQQHETAIATAEHAIELLKRDDEARKRGIADSRAEQATLLGAVELVDRHSGDQPNSSFAATPLDRIHRALLIEGTVPVLRREMHALAGDIQRIAALEKEIPARTQTLAAARAALATDRDNLATLTARRLALTRKALPEDTAGATRLAKLARDADDLSDLIKRADAASDRRDKDILARAREKPKKGGKAEATSESADPTRPNALRAFDPPQSSLVIPIAGSVSVAFGAASSDGGAASQGLRLTAGLAGAEVVAPFGGRIVYAGPFRNLGVGLTLIIRHAGGYHSVLSGLGRIDSKVDQWLRAGEPIGALPDTANQTTSGSGLYFELRRDDRPVDPQPWLAPREQARDDKTSDPSGDQKVRE